MFCDHSCVTTSVCDCSPNCTVYSTLPHSQGNIHLKPTAIETRFKAGDMVAVGNTIVVAQHRGSHLVLCCADTADVIGSIDVTDLCGIYRECMGAACTCGFVGSTPTICIVYD